MYLFNKRPLSLIICLFLCGFVAFSYLDSIAARAVLVFAALALLSVPFLYRLVRSKRLSSEILCITASLAIIVSTVFSFLYFDLWFYAHERFEGYVRISGTVTDYEQREFNDRYTVKTDNISGEALTKYTIYFDTERNETYLNPGYEISFIAKLEELPEDARSYYAARGINAVATDVTEIEITNESAPPLAVKLSELRYALTMHAVSCSDYETGTLTAALLLGERGLLSGSTGIDFSRIGISHVLALSGMHLAILSYAINKLLSLLGVNKKYRTPLLVLFAFLYMLFTGFSVTIVRAGIMMIISSLLFLLSRARDSVTSLFVAVLIIVCLTPYAIFDVSLWLSAFATLGVLISVEYAEIIPLGNSPLKRLGRKALITLTPSLFAVGATLLITAYTFGTVSYIAPFTTILFSFLIEIIMYLGTLMLIFGKIIPLGALLSPICRATTYLAGYLSDLEFVNGAAIDGFIMIFIVIFTAAFLAFSIAKPKRTHLWATVLLIIMTLTLTSSYTGSIIKDGEKSLIYYSEEKYDAFLIRSEKEACFAVSATYNDRDAYIAARQLSEDGVSYLDKCLLTHYSKGITEFTETLLARIRIKSIVIRQPENEEEAKIAVKLKEAARKFRTEVLLTDVKDSESIGNASVFSLKSTPYGVDSSVNSLLISYEGIQITYLSSGVYETKDFPSYSAVLQTTDYIIHGSHGKSYKEDQQFNLSLPDLSGIVFPENGFMISTDTDNYYKENGCEIYSHPKRLEIPIN